VPFSFFRLLLPALVLSLTSCRSTPPALQLPADLSFTDLASGQPFDTTSIHGKLLLLNLWAAWSPASAKELPELVALHEKFAPRGLVLLGVSLDEAPAAGLLVFAERHGIRYPLVRPGPKALDLLEPLETIPYTLLLSPQGKILARFRGPLKPSDLRSAIEKNL
jgi:thiol-disulfide isomerase/thioredoxin